MSRRHKAKAPPKTPSESKAPPESFAWLHAVRLLALAAWGISAYLAWSSLTGEGLPGCGPESGCDAVLSSRWGYWLGVPVSLGALLAYALVLGATLGLRQTKGGAAPQMAWWILTFASVLIPGTAFWFIGVQWILIHKFCPFCMAAHACGLGMSGLIVFRLWRNTERARQVRDRRVAGILTSGQLRAGVRAGLAAVAVLVGGQLLHQPRTFTVQSLPTGIAIRAVGSNTPPLAIGTSPETASNAPAVSSSGSSPSSNIASLTVVRSNPPPPQARELELHGGVFRLDLQSVPIYGRPDAPHVAVSLFDYTCPHCRQVHKHLMEAHRSFSNELAIVSLPMPLDPECNPIVKRPLAEHTNACAYARIGLGVWRADRARMQTFDDWMFSSPRPPSVAEARTRAGELVGTNALRLAMKDPWIDQLIETSIRLYHTNYLHYKRSRMPEIMIGSSLVSGSLYDVRQLYGLLNSEFGLPIPPSASAPRPRPEPSKPPE